MKSIRTWTFVAWCLLVVLAGYFYVRNRIYSPEATPGYETMWSFQLAMFAIFRLPILLIFLCAVLLVETKFFRNRKDDSQSTADSVGTHGVPPKR